LRSSTVVGDVVVDDRAGRAATVVVTDVGATDVGATVLEGMVTDEVMGWTSGLASSWPVAKAAPAVIVTNAAEPAAMSAVRRCMGAPFVG